MDDLTKEQQYLLLSMYKEVLSRQPALGLDDANYFSSSDEVRNLFSPDSSSDHIASQCWKLSEKGYLFCSRGDDLANDISLTDKTIIYMENRFSKKINAIIDFILKIKP